MENVSIEFANGSRLTAAFATPSEVKDLVAPAPARVVGTLETHDLETAVRIIVGYDEGFGHRILAIKLVRATLGLHLKEAKEWVDTRHPRKPINTDGVPY